jgi:hypothetical protein
MRSCWKQHARSRSSHLVHRAQLAPPTFGRRWPRPSPPESINDACIDQIESEVNRLLFDTGTLLAPASAGSGPRPVPSPVGGTSSTVQRQLRTISQYTGATDEEKGATCRLVHGDTSPKALPSPLPHDNPLPPLPARFSAAARMHPPPPQSANCGRRWYPPVGCMHASPLGHDGRMLVKCVLKSCHVSRNGTPFMASPGAWREMWATQEPHSSAAGVLPCSAGRNWRSAPHGASHSVVLKYCRPLTVLQVSTGARVRRPQVQAGAAQLCRNAVAARGAETGTHGITYRHSRYRPTAATAAAATAAAPALLPALLLPCLHCDSSGLDAASSCRGCSTG